MNERVELAVEIPAQPRCKNLEPWTKNKVRAQRKWLYSIESSCSREARLFLRGTSTLLYINNEPDLYNT